MVKQNIKESQESIFMRNIQRGIDKKIITLSVDQTKITYLCYRDYTSSFKNPEEIVRGSYFAELILDYNYPNKRIDFEVRVPRRTPEDRADIVIYEDDELKKPYLVVECKKDSITDAEYKQAIEQVFGNANSLRAKLASVVAGTTKTAFNVAGFKPKEREKNVISDIPKKYGKTPKYNFIKGQKDLKIVSKDELISALQKCHDTVWQGGRLAPTTAFDEVSKLLFCKLKDERDTPKNHAYQFQPGTHETAEEVFKRVKNIYQKAKKQDAEVFKEDIRLDPKIVYSVVEHLQALAIGKIDLDTKGVAFEKFMEDFFKGKMGQFFTPREIIRFCVKMLNPEKDDLILDPACGSGGFLLNTMDEVREFAEKNYDEREAYNHWHEFAKNNLYGIEINDQIARVCKMNMIIHDDGHTNVISTDSLRDFGEIEDIHKGFREDYFDIILTNPPFGAVVKSTEKDYLEKYELGKDKENQKTEIMFIERCINFIKPKVGRIAIVLPDSIAINTTLQYVRDFILEKTQILAVVSLPDFAFTHYGANVKSSLLFLRRLNKNERVSDYPIFMAEAEGIGYTAAGKHDDVNDLIPIAEYFSKFQKHKKIKIEKEYQDRIFRVTLNELKGKRIDPKGYAKRFKELKRMIQKSKYPKIALHKCIKESISGEWGLDTDASVSENNFELCYVLRNTNFDNNFNLDFSDVALRYVDKAKILKLQLKDDDILVEKSGGSPIQPVGRVAIIQNLRFDKPVLFSNFLQKITIDKTVINPDYVYSFLRTLYQMGYMEHIQNQTTGIKNLLMEEFFSIPLIKPSKSEQEKIAKKYIDDMIKVKEDIKKAYRNLNKSRQIVKEMIVK